MYPVCTAVGLTTRCSGLATLAAELDIVRRHAMTEYHKDPYRGPIADGLPGFAVSLFALALMVFLLRIFMPLWVVIATAVTAVAFFLLLRMPRRHI